MTSKPFAIVALCVAGAILVLLYTVSIMLMYGKLGNLLSGYNFCAVGKRAKACEKYALKRAGAIILGLSIGISVVLLFVALYIFTAVYIVAALTGVWLIGGIIYLNFDKKIQRALFLAQKLTYNPYYVDELSPNDNFWKDEKIDIELTIKAEE